MNTVRRLALVISAVLFITATSAMSFGEDPPSRAARLNYISGSVSVQPGGVNDWTEASINRTLTTSDRIWADKDSRAELQLDGAAVRLNSETSVTLTNVSDNSTQIELDQGQLYLSISHLFDGQIYEVDTPNVAFTVLRSGRYRFDVDSNGDTTRILVHRGEGQATGDGPAVVIHEREGARFSGGRSMANQKFEDPGYDGFDDWAATRDKRQEHSVSARYVSPGVVGYEDLDDYGYWRTIPPYGPVWVPAAVAPGWAPYRFGHWAWVGPWGWTWVDDAPWGYAPFHYGRWCYVGGSWGWVPGPIYVRPVWAPALVAWVGGPSFGVSIGFGVGGGYGWFPLGYREPFVPWYGGSRNYFRQVNVTNTNITNITNVTNNYYNNPTNVNRITYVNRTVPGAVTAVPAHTLENGRPVQTAAVRVNPNQLRGATVMARPNVQPTQNAVLGVHAGARASAPPTTMVSRPVVTKMAPPAPRQPFGGQRAVVNDGNHVGQPGNLAKPGNTVAPGQGMNASKPAMNVPKPGAPAMNTNVAHPGNNPAVVRDTKPEFSPNVHRPPAVGGNTPSGMKTTGPATGPATNVAHPGNRSVDNGEFKPGPGGAVNKNVQMNPTVPRPGETGGRPNAAVTPSGSSVPHPVSNVQDSPKIQPADVQPRPNVGGNVPHPGGQGSGYPHPNQQVNTHVNESGNVSGGQAYPRGGSVNTRVNESGNVSGGHSNQGQPKASQPKSEPKNKEEHPKNGPQGNLRSVPTSPATGASARASYRYPRPQPGQVRPADRSVAQASSGRSGQSTYSSGSNATYANRGSNYGYSRNSSASGYTANRGSSSYGYGNSSAQSSRANSSPSYSSRTYGSAGSYNRGGSTAGSYNRGGSSAGSYSRSGSYSAGSSGSYSRGGSSSGGSYSRSSGTSGRSSGSSSSGGGHSHGR